MHVTYGIKQYLQGMPWYHTMLLLSQNYLTTSLALARPSLTPLLTQQPQRSVQGRGFPATNPAALVWLSCCLWMTVLHCPGSGIYPGSWPGPAVLYDITIGSATVYGLALLLRLSHKFIGLISVCCHCLNGLHCLLLTPGESAGRQSI